MRAIRKMQPRVFPKPRRRNTITKKLKGSVCVCCEDIASMVLQIENSPDPEENSVVPTCKRHTDMAFDTPLRFFQHMHGRQEHLKYLKEECATPSPSL